MTETIPARSWWLSAIATAIAFSGARAFAVANDSAHPDAVAVGTAAVVAMVNLTVLRMAYSGAIDAVDPDDAPGFHDQGEAR